MGVLGDAIRADASEVDTVELARDNCQQQLAAARAELDAANAEIARLQAELEACAEQPGFLPLATGLITTFGPGGPDGWIPNIAWKDVEPTRGVYDWTVLDDALAVGRVARVRLMAGMHSPDWLKTLAGTVTMVNQTDGKTGICPRWWTPAAIDAYAGFEESFDENFDGAVPAVSMSAGMTIYAEPLMRELASATTRANLQAAGFTADADLAALRAGMAAHQGLARTRTFMAFNPYMRLNPDGTFDIADLDTAIALMGDLRTALPSSIVQNNSIRWPVLGGDYPGLYAAMTAPKSFQTAGASRIGDVTATLGWAVDQGAHLVESFVGAYDGLHNPDEIRAGLAANAG